MVNKNLMEVSNGNLNTIGEMSFLYPIRVDGVDVQKYNTDATSANHPVLSGNAAYNKNYHKRMILTKSGDIHVIIELENIEFFASLKNILLPPTQVHITIDIGTDNILLHKAAAVDVAKITIKNIWLCYEKLTLSASNKLAYAKFLSEPQTFKFYQESIKAQTALKNYEKSIILYETASKPRDLFVSFSHTENKNSQNKD